MTLKPTVGELIILLQGKRFLYNAFLLRGLTSPECPQQAWVNEATRLNHPHLKDGRTDAAPWLEPIPTIMGEFGIGHMNA